MMLHHFIEPEISLHNIPPLVYPVHTLPSHFCNINFNNVLPSTSGFSQWSLSWKVSYQHFVFASLLTHTCYTLCQSHPWIWAVWIKMMILLITQFSPVFCYFISLGYKNSPSILFSDTLNPYSSLNGRDKVSHSCKTTGKNLWVWNLFLTLKD